MDHIASKHVSALFHELTRQTTVPTMCEFRRQLSQLRYMKSVMLLIGLWHEQSRPDCDHYVRILWDNIATKHHCAVFFFFLFREEGLIHLELCVSVMNYPIYAFNIRPGPNVMEIVNREWYKEQSLKYPSLN